LRWLQLNAIDIAFIGCMSGLIIYTLHWKTSSAFVFRAESAFLLLGLYFCSAI
jgi:hypothetical protein